MKRTGILYITLFSIYLKFAASSRHDRAFLGGDVILGSLMPIHLANGSRGCGHLNEDGFVLSQALIFAVEEINRNPEILPNVTLGYDIRNYCSNPAIALKHTYKILQNSSRLNIPLIIGPTDSGSAVLVGGLLQAVDMPAISPSTTSNELSQPLYRSFFRTISSDDSQARVMADIIEQFKWQYIAAIALDSSYGRNGLRSLEQESFRRRSFCVAFKEYLPSTEQPQLILAIVRKLKLMKTIDVVLLWSNANGAWRFLEETVRQKVLGKTWILSEAMTKELNNKFLRKYSNVLAYSIGIHPYRYNLSSFKTFLGNLVPRRKYNLANPWLREIWELHYNKNSNLSVDNEWFNGIGQAFVPYLIDAVYAVALALDNMYKCGEPGLLAGSKCPKLEPHLVPVDLSIYLRNVSFFGITGKVAFDKHGDPLSSSYEILNFQTYTENNTQTAKLIKVGTWSKKELTLNKSLIQWVVPGTVPTSVCKHNCKPGTMQTATIACCWECIPCNVNTVSQSYGSRSCSPCPKDQKANINRTRCVDLPVSIITWTKGPSMICVCLASVGICLCILAIFVFIKHKTTPLVKSSGFELCIIFLVLIAAHFALSLVYFAQPNDILCSIREPWRYASLTGCISILLLKTLRLVSAFELVTIGDWFKKYLKTAQKQIFTLIVINAAGIILCLIWLLTDPPYSHREIFARKNISVICISHQETIGKVFQGLTIAYLFILCLFCTFYATKARKLPGNFNETRLIGFSMYSLILSWITFYSVDFSLESPDESVVASSTILLSSYAMLCFMFGSKLNIILRHPEKNTQECVKSGVTSYTFNTCRRTELSLDVISNAYTLGRFEQGANHK